MDHTTSNTETDISLLPSLLKVFAMFQMHLLYHEHNEDIVEAIDIQCSNFHINTGLHLKDKTVEEIITQFLLNSVFHHVGLSLIISSNKRIKYEIGKDNPDLLNKGPWYNTIIRYKFHGTVFEDCIRNYRTYRYNIIFSITSHYRQQPTYVSDAISSVGRSISNNSTIAAL